MVLSYISDIVIRRNKLCVLIYDRFVRGLKEGKMYSDTYKVQKGHR